MCDFDGISERRLKSSVSPITPGSNRVAKKDGLKELDPSLPQQIVNISESESPEALSPDHMSFHHPEAGNTGGPELPQIGLSLHIKNQMKLLKDRFQNQIEMY